MSWNISKGTYRRKINFGSVKIYQNTCFGEVITRKIGITCTLVFKADLGHYNSIFVCYTFGYLSVVSADVKITTQKYVLIMIGLFIARKKLENKETLNFVKFMLTMRKWNDIFQRKPHGFAKTASWYFWSRFCKRCTVTPVKISSYL